MDMNGTNPYSMKMWMHFREHEYILFKFWKSGSLGGMAVSMLITFLLCILYEAIKGLRMFIALEHIKRRRRHANSRPRSPLADGDNNSEASVSWAPLLQLSGDPRFTRRLFTPFRMAQAGLYGIQAMLAYCLMLIVMTFNGNLMLSVVVGEAVGYFLFTGTPLLDGPLADNCH